MNRKWLVGLGSGLMILSSALGIAHAATVSKQSAHPVVSQVQAEAQLQDAAGTDTEKKAVQTEGEAVKFGEDESLPGGGHADPDGVNVDHQFQGVE
ncbi:hypothetical protein [Ammonifex thiophilus]|uniref:Uncharacterized protein n=1 Tax=Ammonifex thiophilus TaxID=444093 RepID=A0A3D8P412_9THEO|nr:hypothetical protein [Ammonifex thiophilus]RDV83641.1 hypothetical protein DXX99_04915 [Ammonifex thiophilus]